MSKQRVSVASKKFKMSEASTSGLSSICTPMRRMTRSSLTEIANKEMPPLPMKKVAIENSENETTNDHKSTKSLTENSSTVKKEIDTVACSSVELIGKKVQRAELTIPMENDQSVLNKTFDMESNCQENVQEKRLAISNKKPNPKITVSIIDLTESPVAENSTVNMVVLKTEDENTILVNDATVTEDDDLEDIPAKEKTFPNPKPASSQTPLTLNRLQSKKPTKKAISMAKTVKITEVAEHLVKEINQTDTLNLPITKTGRSEQVTSTPFRFGLAQNVRGFNFHLKGTKIPILNLKELKQKNEVKAETPATTHKTEASVTKSKVKLVPNFKAIHQRIFENDLPIDEIENHRIKRAKLIKSGTKLYTEENIFQPTQPKSKRKLEMNIIQPKIERSKPLSNVNARAKLNSKQREERRKMMFKQGLMGQSKKIAEKVIIKGVRSNRRFDLMMEQRSKLKNDINEPSLV